MVDKTYILGKLTYHLEQLVNELNKTIIDLASESDLPEDETFDPEDSSYQNNSTEMKHHYQTLLLASKTDLDKLRSFEQLTVDQVVPGALIVTDQVLIFVGVAIPRLHLKEHPTLIGISTSSPVYQSLQHKRIGDTIMFDDKEIKIKNII